MGYRSEVIYVIVGPTDQMIAFATALTLESVALAEALRECVLTPYDTTGAELALAFKEEDVKWYESYPEVIAHETIWSRAEQESDDRKFYGGFARIGEDSNDTVERTFGGEWGEPYELASVNRSIYSNFDFEGAEDVRDRKETLCASSS